MRQFVEVIGWVLIFLFVGGLDQSLQAQKKKKKKKSEKSVIVDQNEILKLVFEGERQELLENNVKAASYYRECINRDPENSVCYYKLASLYNLRGDYNGSVNLSSKAIEYDPTNNWYYLLLAHNYMALGNLEEATKTFKTLVELDPNKSEYRFELANLYTQQGNFKEAIAILTAFEEKHGINPEISILKQNLYVQNGQTEKAIESCKTLISRFPNEANYYGLLAELYIQNNDSDKALDAFNRLIELEPGNGLAHFSLANFYYTSGDQVRFRQEMVLAFKSKDLEVESKLNSLLPYLSQEKITQEEWSLIDELLDALETANSGDARVYALISDFYYRKKDLETARRYTRQSLSIQKDKFQVWNQLILMDSEMQDWEAMVKDGEEALELFPSNPAFYYYLGVAYTQLERFEEAIEILETGKLMIFKNEGGVVDFQSLLGDVYNSAGNYKKSAENYEKVLQVQPDNVYVLNNYSYYLSLRKEDLDKALKMAKRAVDLQPGQYNYEDTYGWVLFQAGDFNEAVIWLEKSVNNGGYVNGEILEHFGDALYMSGNKEKALEVWKQAEATGSASKDITKKIEEQKILELN